MGTMKKIYKPKLTNEKKLNLFLKTIKDGKRKDK